MSLKHHIFSLGLVALSLSCQTQEDQALRKLGGHRLKLEQIEVCKLISAEEVAEHLDAEVLLAHTSSDYGTTQGCEYELAPPGDNGYELCAIWIWPPSSYRAPEIVTAAGERLGLDLAIEPITGMQQEGYVVNNRTERQSTVCLRFEDDYVIEVTAGDSARALRLTKLLLTKIHFDENPELE